jgi:hypothetical protein
MDRQQQGCAACACPRPNRFAWRAAQKAGRQARTLIQRLLLLLFDKRISCAGLLQSLIFELLSGVRSGTKKHNDQCDAVEMFGEKREIPMTYATLLYKNVTDKVRQSLPSLSAKCTSLINHIQLHFLSFCNLKVANVGRRKKFN